MNVLANPILEATVLEADVLMNANQEGGEEMEKTSLHSSPHPLPSPPLLLQSYLASSVQFPELKKN